MAETVASLEPLECWIVFSAIHILHNVDSEYTVDEKLLFFLKSFFATGMLF